MSTHTTEPRRICDAPDLAAEPHSVKIRFESGEWPTVTFTCTAPEGATCRMVPKCMYEGGRCYDLEGHHSSECDPDRDREQVDAGECVVKTWIDIDPSIMGAGEISLPVATEWTGDDWLFKVSESA